MMKYPMLPSLTHRATLAERMDDPDCCEARLLRTIRQFASVNRLVSRYRTILKRWVLDDMDLDPGRHYHLVDLGAGGCDIAAWLLRAAARRGLRLRITAWEIDPRIAAYARARHRHTPGLTIHQTDALTATPTEPADYLFANHFLHHLTDSQITALLAHWSGRVRRRLVFSDLRRSRTAYLGHALLGSCYRGSFIREDGLRSIRRAFLPGELAAHAASAGLADRTTIHCLAPARLVLATEPGPAVRADRSAAVPGPVTT